MITMRPTVRELEPFLTQKIPVLDHGFVNVVDYMGDDAAIVQASRVSYGSGTKSVQEDAALIRYLMRHRHTTPFEMCEIKYHIKLPIFVARQWIRHRTANVNEISARYSVLDKEFYIPEPQQLAIQSKSNHQGRGDILDPDTAATVMNLLRADAIIAHEHYALLLSTGLARELSRINLTLNTYTQWYWKIDLHNLLHFLSLRLDPHAQYEIRVYAEALASTVAAWVPEAYAAFVEYRQNAFTFSNGMLKVLRRMLAGEDVPPEASGLSTREYREMMGVLK